MINSLFGSFDGICWLIVFIKLFHSSDGLDANTNFFEKNTVLYSSTTIISLIIPLEFSSKLMFVMSHVGGLFRFFNTWHIKIKLKLECAIPHIDIVLDYTYANQLNNTKDTDKKKTASSKLIKGFADCQV